MGGVMGWRLGVLLFLISSVGFACTTFLIPNSPNVVMGKSFDWDESHGMWMANKANVLKKGLGLKPTDNPPSWKSKYASFTVNHVGREFPLNGINEKGLTVEIMIGGDNDLPVDGRPSLNEVQWIQYQLDNFALVTEVLENAPKLRISRIRESVHYLICDATASCGVVEYDAKAKEPLIRVFPKDMVVNTLANSFYDESVRYLKRFVGFGGFEEIPKSMSSLDRFVRASSLAKGYRPGTDAVQHAVKVLDSVYAGHTQLNIVYEIALRNVTYRTRRNPRLRSVNATKFDSSCRAPVQVLNLHEGEGEMTASFEDYRYEANQELVDETLGGELPPKVLEMIGRYPDSLPCDERD